MTYGADNVQRELRHELERYITTQYLSKTPVLVEALKDRLDDEGILYRTPYIEAAPAYVAKPNGIEEANLPAWLKTFFSALAKAHLGVYPAPFSHQIQALEAAVRGRDLFVATIMARLSRQKSDNFIMNQAAAFAASSNMAGKYASAGGMFPMAEWQRA